MLLRPLHAHVYPHVCPIEAPSQQVTHLILVLHAIHALLLVWLLHLRSVLSTVTRTDCLGRWSKRMLGRLARTGTHPTR